MTNHFYYVIQRTPNAAISYLVKSPLLLADFTEQFKRTVIPSYKIHITIYDLGTREPLPEDRNTATLCTFFTGFDQSNPKRFHIRPGVYWQGVFIDVNSLEVFSYRDIKFASICNWLDEWPRILYNYNYTTFFLSPPTTITKE